MNRFIKIEAFADGSRENQTSSANIHPEGFAIIPKNIQIPHTYPFVHLEVRDGIVTSMTPNEEAYAKAIENITPPEQASTPLDVIVDALLE